MEGWNETVIRYAYYLWALDDNLKLSNQARELIMDAKNDIYYSSASNVIKLNVKMRRKQVEKIKHNEIWVD